MKVFFCHIPKTGGRYFWANTFRMINHDYLTKIGQYTDVILAPGNAHLSSNLIDSLDDCLSFGILREPVSRTVSHWCHLHRYQFNVEPTKIEFLDYIRSSNAEILLNYQTKFLSFTKHNKDIPINTEFSNTSATESGYTLALQRLDNLTYVLRMDDITPDALLKYRNAIYTSLGMEPNYEGVIVELNYAKSDWSSYIYNLLTLSEKKEIENMMPYDVRLYSEANYRC